MWERRDTTTAGAGRVLAAIAAAAVLAAVALLCVLRPLSVVLPALGLDLSWMAVLGEAATWPARWGVDLAFTYGPASALVTRYFTDGYLVRALPVIVGVAVVHGACLVRLAALAEHGRRFGIVVMAVLAAEVLGLSAELAQDQDGFYFAFGLALFLLALRREKGDRASTIVLAAGAALLGVLALAKSSYGVLAFGLFALADLGSLVAERRMPLLTPAFLAAFLMAFLAYGQHPGDLPAYLSLQGQVAAGYGEAMYLPVSRPELGCFLSGALALVAVATRVSPRGSSARTIVASGTTFTFAIAFKAGFIRADTHPQISWSLLGLGGLVIALGLVLPRSRAAAAALAVTSLAVLWVLAPLFLLAAPGRAVVPGRLSEIYGDMARHLGAEVAAWGGFVGDPSDFAAAARRHKAAVWAEIRAAEPLPRLSGGVDILPSEQSAVLASGLDYDPRPSFQDYSTYTAGLIAANAAFYAGPNAPDWVLFGIDRIDDRYPTTAEGALWPELVRRYEPVRRVGRGVALHRRVVPLPEVLGPPVRIVARLGEGVVLPKAGPTFARIIVTRTALGRLATALFRPPALSLRVTLRGGGALGYRFIPAIGAGGFLLSPMIEDGDAFARFAFGAGEATDGTQVEGFLVGGSRWARLFYDPSVSVELQPFVVPPVPPSPEARALFDDLAAKLPWRRLVHALGLVSELDGDRLSAPAPTVLTVPVAGDHRLRVDFGIYDDAWTEKRTGGVCFTVRAAADDRASLWRRCLDPLAVPADRGQQSAEIELPPSLAGVTAETSCRESCDWGWSYWSDIAPER